MAGCHLGVKASDVNFEYHSLMGNFNLNKFIEVLTTYNIISEQNRIVHKKFL